MNDLPYYPDHLKAAVAQNMLVPFQVRMCGETRSPLLNLLLLSGSSFLYLISTTAGTEVTVHDMLLVCFT